MSATTTPVAQVASAAEGGGAGNFGIRQGDSTFALIRQNAGAMRKYACVSADCIIGIAAHAAIHIHAIDCDLEPVVAAQPVCWRR